MSVGGGRSRVRRGRGRGGGARNGRGGRAGCGGGGGWGGGGGGADRRGMTGRVWRGPCFVVYRTRLPSGGDSPMHLILPESDRPLLQASEYATLSIVAHAVVVWFALSPATNRFRLPTE